MLTKDTQVVGVPGEEANVGRHHYQMKIVFSILHLECCIFSFSANTSKIYSCYTDNLTISNVSL